MPGAGGNTGVAMVAKAPPDGYTVLVVSTGFIVNPSMYAKVPYDPIKDFAPITLVAASPNVITANLQVPAKSLKELIALIKANPGKYSFAQPATGSTPHLAGELFKLKYNLDLVTVPFNGAALAINSTLGGHTPIAFTALPPAMANVREGKLRGIALLATKRSPRCRTSRPTSKPGFPIWKAIRSPASSRPPERRRTSSTAGATRSPRRSPRRTSSSAWRRWALRRSPTRRLNSANASRPRWRDGPRSCTTPRSGRIRMRGRLGQSALHVCIADQFETAQRRRQSKM